MVADFDKENEWIEGKFMDENSLLEKLENLIDPTFLDRALAAGGVSGGRAIADQVVTLLSGRS